MSLMKNYEADLKRLSSIMQNYEEKKADLADQEKKERLEIIQLTRDCFNLFKMAYNDQTNRIERGILGQNNDASGVGEFPSMIETNVSRIIHDNETQ